MTEEPLNFRLTLNELRIIAAWAKYYASDYTLLGDEKALYNDVVSLKELFNGHP